MVFLCDFDPSQAWLRGSTGRKDPLSGVGQPPLPQFRLLGILRLKKERQGGPPGGSFLGRASFQRRGEKELLWEKGQDVRKRLIYERRTNRIQELRSPGRGRDALLRAKLGAGNQP
ncbi:uncharacterized protein [Symphalangus syndactylus]